MKSAVLLAVLALLLGGCSGGDQETTPTPSSTGTAAASPTSAPDGTPYAALLEPVTSPLVKSMHRAGEVLDVDFAVAFMDTASGAIELWSFVDQPAPEDSRQLSPSSDGRLLVLHLGTTPVRHYVVQRETGAAYEFKGGWVPDRSLGFGNVIGAWNGADFASLVLLDIAHGTTIPTGLTREFLSNSSRVSSPDGTSFAVGNGAEFYLVSAKTGASRLVKDGLYNYRVSPLPHGRGFALGPEGPGESLNFDWDGNPLPPGNAFNLSPDGSLRAIPGSPGSILSLGLGAFPVIDTVTIVDAATGVARVRFLGASFHGWAADSYTLMVGDEEGGERIINLDGYDFTRLPYPGLVQGGIQFSPVDPSLVITNRAIVNIRSGWRLELVVGDGISTSGRWSVDGSEVAFWIFPTPGKDGGVAAQLLPLKYQAAPFTDEVALKVSMGGDCLNLRDAPAGTAAVLACLPDGTHLTFETVLLTTNPKEPPREFIGQRTEDSSTWLHVRTGDGRSGWVDATYVRWAD